VENIGNFKIFKKIASGGMATVYIGTQLSLNRPVAIKILHKQFIDDPQLVDRFNKESLIIARLSHPNIIQVIDRGITTQKMPYFIMNFIKGTDTARLIKEKKYNINQKLDLIIQVCKALSYAHKNNVIHRDIKPANILIDVEGNTIVTDFGIAQFYNESFQDNQLTKNNLILGTLAYMSPEQKTDSKNITASSDIYSLGVVMYELFTGIQPLGNFKPPSAICPEIGHNLNDLILMCLSPDLSNRPSSTDIIKDFLLKLLQGAHIKDDKKKEAVKGVTEMEDVFNLLDIIKEHRFGAVYLFRHKVKKELMVVKRYNVPLGGFKSAKLLRNLTHPNIVDIYGVSGTDKNYIIVMEYLSGGSLADRMIQPYELNHAIKIILKICKGLEFAHRNRILHGNLRPSNILFTQSDKVKISDFGLNEHNIYTHNKDKMSYALKETKSKHADILTLGTIFYKMLTGKDPVHRRYGLVAHQSFRAFPAEIQTLIMRMLSKKSKTRFQSIDQLIDYIHKLNIMLKMKQPDIDKNEKHPLPLKSKKRKIAFWMVISFFIFSAAGVYIAISRFGIDNLDKFQMFFKELLKTIQIF